MRKIFLTALLTTVLINGTIAEGNKHFSLYAKDEIKNEIKDKSFPLEVNVKITPEEGFMNNGWGSIIFDFQSNSSTDITVKEVTGKWFAGDKSYHSFRVDFNLNVSKYKKVSKSFITWMPGDSENLSKDKRPIVKGEIILTDGRKQDYSVVIPIAELPAPTKLIKGKKIGLELQEKTWKTVKDSKKIIKYLDDVYKYMEELTSNKPYDEKLLTLKESPRNPYFAYAGNPIILNTAFVEGSVASFDNDLVDFGWVHEIGHDFDDQIGHWYNDGTFTEFQANIKLSYVIENMCTEKKKLKIKSFIDHNTIMNGYDFNSELFIPRGEKYLFSDRKFETMTSDEYHALFLKVIREKGWGVMKKFYKAFGKLSKSKLNPPTGQERIFLALSVFDYVSGEDLEPLYKEWRIPLSRTKMNNLIKQYHIDTLV